MGHGGQQEGVCQQGYSGSEATCSIIRFLDVKNHLKYGTSEALRRAGLPTLASLNFQPSKGNKWDLLKH